MKRVSALIVPLLLGAQASLLAWTAAHNSVTVDETGHLPAGLSIWQLGRFDLYRVNPPLTRMLAALPVALAAPKTDWRRWGEGLLARPEWLVGEDFIAANPDDWFWYFFLGRCALIPLSLFGAAVCYRWGRDLYGFWSGVAALALWCFCPNMIAHGATISADAGAACLGVVAGYAFWRWLRHSTWTNASIAGVALGLAELAKTQWVVLFALWPVLWWARRRYSASGGTRSARSLAQLIAALLLGLLVLNAGYGFTGSLRLLGDYQFASRALGGTNLPTANRFSGTWLACFPIPLPSDYVTGIDLQKLDFERGTRSYLRGEWRDGGFWYYYVYAALVKVPLGTLLLGLLAVTVRPWGGRRFGWSDGCLLAPALAVFTLVSWQSGAVQYFRYVLPTLPFGFIFAGSALAPLEAPAQLRGQARSATMLRGSSVVVAAAVAYSAVSSLSVFPHSMSYFNEIAGGPERGHEHLVGADIDAGQDDWYLREWADRHPEAAPLRVALAGLVDPHHYGIRCESLGGGGRIRWRDSTANARDDLARDGAWYAVSVNELHSQGGRFSGFLRLRPKASIGYSTYVYHLD